MGEAGLDHWADILVVVLYFAFVLGVGIWTVFRKDRGSVKSYFLAGRDMMWLPVGASLFASNIGSEHFIGLAGTGASSGIAIILYEWMSVPLVIILAWLFVPVYVSAGVYTLPEFLQKRFGGQRLRVYLSFVVLALYIVTKLAVSIYAGGLFIQLALGWNMYVAIVALLVVTGVYTVLGGLTAVIYTDAVQCFIMMIGACALTGISFKEVGGFSRLEEEYFRSRANTSHLNISGDCGAPRDDAFHVFRDPINSDNPWPGLLLQSSIGCLWYWCADQVIVQRALAARSLSHAKGGAILAGYLKLVPIFLMVLPGMISRALYPDKIGCVGEEACKAACGNPAGCSNLAYPWLVINLMPVGLRGLLLSVMLAAIMSSLTSIFNSASAVFTLDLWRRFRPHALQRELLIVGRVFIVILCGVSILWIPMVESSQGGQLFVYIQAVQGYLGTPIGIVFLLAILWPRMNEHGAFWGLLLGHALGVVRFVLDFVYPAPPCGQEDNRPAVTKLHYAYYCSIVIVILVIAAVFISLVTKPLSEERLLGTTWWTRTWYKTDGGEEGQTFVIRKDGQHPELELNGSSDTRAVNQPETEAEADEEKARHNRNSPHPSCWRRWLNTVCGGQESEAKEEPREVRTAWLKEGRRMRIVLGVNAVLALAVTIVLCGVFH